MRTGLALSVVSGLLGFAGMAALLAQHGVPAIFGLISSIGWGLGVIVLVRVFTLVAAGLGWAWLVIPFARVERAVFPLLRWVRESINVLLPVAQVGGDLMGGRLLTFWNVPTGLAGASILVDLLIQLGTQLLFALLGLGVLALAGGDHRLVEYVGGGLGVSAFGLLGFYFAQRSRFLGIVEDALIERANRWRVAPITEGRRLHDSLRAIHGRSGALLASFALHQVAWFLGVAEIWIALACMGLNPSLGECVVLESLGQAVRSAAFAVPGALGVQEGGFMLLGGLYGVGPDASLALSLVKRLPDLALGIPGLLAWHLLEVRHLLAGRLRRTRTAPETRPMR
ncbi:MAG: flippase-like domain-containing protein [Acetobacteraceae bacterium]|nr:flippase-like domain-containing protein [Acetobacteraceae bacterium]MBV8590706.1 flippase-like domain-containing protein [Acetobacteraceae bacterium]